MTKRQHYNINRGTVVTAWQSGVGLLLLVTMLFVAGGCRQANVDNGENLLVRSHIDSYNKEAFIQRYRDPAAAIRYTDSALVLLADSLPGYDDGYLRAYNNMAYSSFMLSQYDCMYRFTSALWDSVLVGRHPQHLSIEQTIAQLMDARVLQRRCDIAGSSQILYNIEQSGILTHKEDDYLYHFAIMEYYITALTLNYYFRDEAMERLRALLADCEEVRTTLRCDYAEDISLNYAMAHSYSILCESAPDQSQLLRRALELCDENLRIVSRPDGYDPYHLANVYQLLGLMLSDTLIDSTSWQKNADLVGRLWFIIDHHFGFGLHADEDPALALFMESTSIFWQHDDPYQRLGAAVTTADYAMRLGDTTLAREFYLAALSDTTLVDLIAPKFESQLYAGLIFSEASTDASELKVWSDKLIYLLNYIKQNERADFRLQQELNDAVQLNRTYIIMLIVIGVLFIALTIVAVLLVRRSRELVSETRRLQLAKAQDVERIANMETCLSVLRHDISPFINYLQNKKLPPELYQEVISSMSRTFDNLKAWTTITLPSGLQFRLSHFPLQEVFDSVRSNLYNPYKSALALIFQPCDLQVSGDKQLLQILLRNLVNNAVQHTTQGHVLIAARVYEADNRFVELTVTDTGEGMTPEQIDTLFRTDKTLDNRDNQNHYGFGLILCRYIIKKHDDNTLRGCRIWADSTVGKGSTFHCLIARYTEC